MKQRILKLINSHLELHSKPEAFKNGGFKNKSEHQGYKFGLMAAKALIEEVIK